MAEQKSKKNTEQVKTYEHIRSYMRRFYVYGFETRGELVKKMGESERTYDNERKIVKNWLSKYAIFKSNKKKNKIWYITVDASTISHNPLYNSWKAKSFTKNDIMLHFYLLDILRSGDLLTQDKITEDFYKYFDEFQDVTEIDTSTIGNKLTEYCELGLINMTQPKGKNYYRLADALKDLSQWQSTAAFFSEAVPLGEIGSFILDRVSDYDYFAFKHHFFLYTLDSGILFDLLMAMEEKKDVVMQVYDNTNEQTIDVQCCPLKFYCSTQTGRRYVLCYEYERSQLAMYRLDKIMNVEQGEEYNLDDYKKYLERADDVAPHIWGVSYTGDVELEHLEFQIYVGANEDYILKRLQREKRRGVVTKIDAEHYQFSVDVYDARELLPWVRTFITRITAFDCSNEAVKQIFMQDLNELTAYYSEEM